MMGEYQLVTVRYAVVWSWVCRNQVIKKIRERLLLRSFDNSYCNHNDIDMKYTSGYGITQTLVVSFNNDSIL